MQNNSLPPPHPPPGGRPPTIYTHSIVSEAKTLFFRATNTAAEADIFPLFSKLNSFHRIGLGRFTFKFRHRRKSVDKGGPQRLLDNFQIKKLLRPFLFSRPLD